MGEQQQQTIYVEGLGFIPLATGQTPQDAIAAAQSKRTGQSDVEADALTQQRSEHAGLSAEGGDPNDFVGPQQTGFLGFRNPGDDRSEDVGVNVPPLPRDAAEALMRTFPQMAGLIAQFIPGGKAASFLVPAGISLAQQKWNGEALDPTEAVLEGAMSFGANRVGAGVGAVGKAGRGKVTRALGLKGAEKTDAAIQELTDLAIKEGAEMTEEGADAIRAAGTRRLPSGVKVTSRAHKTLADTLDRTRLDYETAPNRITLWPQEAAANWLRAPARQLAMGRRMANPAFGVSTASHIAPSVESLIRLALMGAAAQEEPPMQTSRGPVRRRLK